MARARKLDVGGSNRTLALLVVLTRVLAVIGFVLWLKDSVCVPKCLIPSSHQALPYQDLLQLSSHKELSKWTVLRRAFDGAGF